MENILVDVRIEGVLVRSCLDSGELYLNRSCLDSGNNSETDFIS